MRKIFHKSIAFSLLMPSLFAASQDRNERPASAASQTSSTSDRSQFAALAPLDVSGDFQGHWDSQPTSQARSEIGSAGIPASQISPLTATVCYTPSADLQGGIALGGVGAPIAAASSAAPSRAEGASGGPLRRANAIYMEGPSGSDVNGSETSSAPIAMGPIDPREAGPPAPALPADGSAGATDGK